MVNYFTNINKTKESLNSDGQLFTNIYKTKESLNSDGQLVHQYQQIKQLPLILSHCIQKGGKWHMTLEIQVLDWDRHKNA